VVLEKERALRGGGRNRRGANGRGESDGSGVGREREALHGGRRHPRTLKGVFRRGNAEALGTNVSGKAGAVGSLGAGG